jgi:hypothetical protein
MEMARITPSARFRRSSITHSKPAAGKNHLAGCILLRPLAKERAQNVMSENNKKTLINRDRWVFLLEFLSQNEDYIKSLLFHAVHPDMLRAEVILNNAAEGIAEITASTIFPEGGNQLVLCSMLRPALFHPDRIKREIENLTKEQIIMSVVNQIDVKK